MFDFTPDFVEMLSTNYMSIASNGTVGQPRNVAQVWVRMNYGSHLERFSDLKPD